MRDFLLTHGGRTVLGLAVLAGMTYAIVWLLKRFRDHNAEDQQTPDEVDGNFAEMQRRGDISLEEYRNIQSVMGSQHKPQADSTEQSG